MTVTFLGATHEVTGSCTLIRSGGHNIIIDCGMEQGADIFENSDLPVTPSQIDCVLLTHAHVDHSGKLPLLVKNGFKGSIYATTATCNLCSIMLLDCAHIQEQEAEWRNRKAKRSGDKEDFPIYDTEDAQNTVKKLVPCHYGVRQRILENLEVRFTDIGHLLGSAAIELWLTEDGETKKIVFSGDVGNTEQPIINNPEPVKEADTVIIESTYGDRLHPEKPDYIKGFTEAIQKTFDRGGNVVIPSFAVGRTQEILYFIREIKHNGLIKGHDGFNVWVDSPLANEATSIFLQSDDENFDEETQALIDKGINPIFFDGLKISVTADESKAINSDKSSKIIISASGMCEAGRIRHHLKHNLWRKECLIMFVGYQAEGTLGRDLLDGKKEVKLFGETIKVKAEIGFLDGVSGHADKNGLLAWLSGFEKKPEHVFVNHGDDDSCKAFTATLNNLGYEAYAPYSGTVYDIRAQKLLVAPEGIPVKKKPANKPASDTYEELLNALKALTDTVNDASGLPNAELRRATEKINELKDLLKIG